MGAWAWHLPLICLTVFKAENGGNRVCFSSSQHHGENSKVTDVRVSSMVQSPPVYWHHMSCHFIPLCPGHSLRSHLALQTFLEMAFLSHLKLILFIVCTPANLQIYFLSFQILLLRTFIYSSKDFSGTFSIEHPSSSLRKYFQPPEVFCQHLL